MSTQFHISEGSIMNNYSTSGEITSPSPISNSSSLGYMMSPEQTVPHSDNKKIHLKILEQPIGKFRFRFKSEIIRSRGCLMGRTSNKSFPTVELKNYPGEAIVACTLVQVDETHSAHPHRLVIYKHNEETCDPHININRKNGHTATFEGMFILYTSKKMIVKELIRRHKINFPHINYKENDLKLEYEKVANTINMNSVCLKFSVFDINERELCEPIYSEPINDTKIDINSPLKIVYASETSGSSLGGDLILLFVEKVDKKNIKVRFFEMQKGVRVWEEFASSSELHVHYQYGIAFKTPPYKDNYPTQDVNVFIELFRPKDHAVSQKVPYCYKALRGHCKMYGADGDKVEVNKTDIENIEADIEKELKDHDRLNEETKRLRSPIVTDGEIENINSQKRLLLNLEQELQQEIDDKRNTILTKETSINTLEKNIVCMSEKEVNELNSELDFNKTDIENIEADIEKELKDHDRLNEETKRLRSPIVTDGEIEDINSQKRLLLNLEQELQQEIDDKRNTILTKETSIERELCSYQKTPVNLEKKVAELQQMNEQLSEEIKKIKKSFENELAKLSKEEEMLTKEYNKCKTTNTEYQN